MCSRPVPRLGRWTSQNAMKPWIQCVLAQWSLGFMQYGLVTGGATGAEGVPVPPRAAPRLSGPVG